MESQVKLRDATRDDLESILGLQNRAPEAAGWTAGDYARLWVAEGAIALLAEDPAWDRAVGFLVARTLADETEIQNLAVAPERRRQGIGRRLLAEALARVHAGGGDYCWLEVRASNQAALAFYRALGFGEKYRRPRYYRDPVEDAVVCVRQLPPAGSAP